MLCAGAVFSLFVAEEDCDRVARGSGVSSDLGSVDCWLGESPLGGEAAITSGSIDDGGTIGASGGMVGRGKSL